MPKLSIITICLNDRAGLERTISSVASQSFDDFEYIVIDGASTDGSQELLKKYPGIISCGISEKDRGIYHAMNKGIRRASGEYCLFLNSGDFLYSPEILKEAFSDNHIEDILYGDLIREQEKSGKIERVLSKQPSKISFFHMYANTLWHPATFINRKLFSKVGMYNEELKIASDYDFFFNAIVIHQVTHRHLPLAIAQYNNQGISSRPESASLLMHECDLVHRKYLLPMVVDEMDGYVRLMNSRGFKYFSALNDLPILRLFVCGLVKLTSLLKLTRQQS